MIQFQKDSYANMVSDLIPTIGLEIHAELKTKTKMFCRSKNDTDETRPNVNICPVCMAHPGTLPVINKEAVRRVLMVGYAVGGRVADYTEFDRKNYFYPDLPKGYQLSQYEYPLVEGGELAGVQLTRIHLEEDTARSQHDDTKGVTLIDYNRAGVPLMELVTEPVIHSAEEAGNFARELRLLLRTLGVSEANMEKGEMRVEANISVAPVGELGTKTEIKNINSFRAMERAVSFEIERQAKLIERGEDVIQETRGWDDTKQVTFPQRIKEGSADYRYFPDPDIPKLVLSEIPEFSWEAITKDTPELPWEKRVRLKAYGIVKDDIELYVKDEALGSFFAEVTGHLGEDPELVKLASNYIASDLVKITRLRADTRGQVRDDQTRDMESQSEISIKPDKFADLIAMIAKQEISSRAGKDILLRMHTEGVDPRKVAENEGLFQSNNADDMLPVVQKVIAEHPEAVSEYKSGKETALQYLVGQGMKEMRGAANPQLLAGLFAKEIL